MFNADKMKLILNSYRNDFNKVVPENGNKSHWENEKYKWVAVKHFQDNWDEDADDFYMMLKESLSKCYNLLDSMNYFPSGMILRFAKVDTDAVRKMFKELFDEQLSVVDRVNRFIQESENLRVKYGDDKWKSHYQNVNSISTYLWLRYPDKYYIYKYGECRQAAVTLESDFKAKKGAKPDVLINFFKFYDEVAEYISRDSDTVNMFREAATPECYSDTFFRTLAIDVCFYISRKYSSDVQNNGENCETEEIKYWPNQDEYEVKITAEQWKEYIKEVEMENHCGCMSMLKALMELGGEASCKTLSVVYGGHPTRYVGCATNIGKRASKYFNISPYSVNGTDSFFTIPFLGREISEDGNKYYAYRGRKELLKALEEIDLSDVDPYVHDEASNKNYWWLNANPSIWSFGDIAVGEEQAYTLYNGNGHKRRVFQNFLDAKVGDIIIGYESTPIKQIVAVAEVSKEQDGKEIVIKKLEGLIEPINYQCLKEYPELENMEFFAQPQGSLFRLTKDEFDCILDIIREQNPIAVKSYHDVYTKNDFLNDVYMTEQQYDSLVSLLKNKRNLVLQGAPGVGKTFAAKRLAYSMMGMIDESRIEFVQFHQNYSYEDFVMGYKPVDSGFELKQGVFYRFCALAANHPDKVYFFIIDEINRGNMSKVFGELLMLIEKDYRGKKITLAYNGMPFAVPDNLYIIGMMNTADRSLAMIDYALRRRFSFYSIKPGFETEGFKKYLTEFNNEKLRKVIDEVINLNKAISLDKSLGPGFSIGHSYFCGHTADENDNWISEVVNYDIVPMLNEYWFDDAENVQKWSDILNGACNG